MPRSLKPPRGIFVSSTVLYHPGMSPCVRDTLIQLLGLAWGDAFVRTPALSYQDLMKITGKKIRTLYGHIAVLRDKHAALRLQSAGDEMYVIVFADWVRPETKPPENCKFLQSPVKEEESDSQNINQNLLLPVNAFEERKGEKQKVLQKFAKRKNFQDYRKKLSEQLCTELVEAGLFPHLLNEISKSSYSETDLRALMSWCRQDEPVTPTALFMARLRAEAQVPKVYYQAACPACGSFGKHAEGCRYGYISGEMADLIEH